MLTPDFASRIDEAGYIEANHPAHFAAEARRLAEIAVAEAARWRERINDDPAAAAHAIANPPAGTPPVHLDFNGAVANGLAGSWKQAEELLAAFTRRAGDHPGLEDLDRQAKKLIQRLGTPEFTVLVESWIAKRRANLKLGEPPVSLPSPGTSVAEAGAAPTRAPKR